MARLIIEGGNKLQGKIKISGNKNAILPCIAAALLTQEELTLKNVPDISDVETMLQILEVLGVSVRRNKNELKIKAADIKTYELPKELTSKLRASVLLAGPLLARVGQAKFFHPGGDIIGKRDISSHLEGFEKFGFEIHIEDREYHGKRNGQIPKEVEIFLDEASVTGTENLILTSVLGDSKITLKNCAEEPHVVDLCNLLIKMGAKIKGVGESTLIIEGVEKLSGAEFSVGFDYVELGTYAVATAVTGGEVILLNCSLKDMEPVINPLSKMGILLEQKDENSVLVAASEIKPVAELRVNIWPGFPTDLMSAFIVLATQAQGVSLLHDWMYESRMFFVDKLISMGANITIADPHRVLVYGPTQLKGRDLETPDIRAGMALVLAALIAKGKSIIHKAELIERGYGNVVEKLASLGASIKRED